MIGSERQRRRARGASGRDRRWQRASGHAIEAVLVTAGVMAFGLLWAGVESARSALSDGDRGPIASAYSLEVSTKASDQPSDQPSDRSPASPGSESLPEAAPSEALSAAVAALPQARVWLLDGYNVLHTAFFRDQPRARWWRGPHRKRLIDCAARFAGEASEIWLVFDGPHPAPDEVLGERLRVHFAPSADAWITRRVRRAELPAEHAVVSSDRQVQGRIAHAGARVVAPADFLAACSPADAPADGSADRVVAQGPPGEPQT